MQLRLGPAAQQVFKRASASVRGQLQTPRALSRQLDPLTGRSGSGGASGTGGKPIPARRKRVTD